MGKFFAQYASPAQVTLGAQGANGQTAPAVSLEVAGINPDGDLQPLMTDANGNLLVSVQDEPTDPRDVNLVSVSGAAITEGQKLMATSLPVVIASDQSSIPVSVASLPLPTGAATSANQVSQIALETNIETNTGSAATELSILNGKVILADTSNVTVTASALPAGAATAANQATEIASLSSVDSKLGTLGQKAMAGSAPVVIASDQSSIPVSGTISVTGVATSANQVTEIASLSSIDGKTPALGQAVMASSSPVVIASNQSAIHTIVDSSALPTGAATETTLSAVNGKLNSLGQKTMTASVPVVIASDQGSLAVSSGGLSSINHVINSYTGSPVTTSAYTQILASTSAAIKEIEIFDSSGQYLVLATGGIGAEVDQIYIFPGGNGRVSLAIAASTRVSIKAVSANATAGVILVNMYG